MLFNLKYDSHKTKYWLNILEFKQLPFAEASALNGIAFRVQDYTRRNLSKKFTLRNKWTERSFKVIKANKYNRQAIVGTSAEYMLEHETGGTFTPKKGQNYSVPQKGVKRTKSGKISKSKFPSRLTAKKYRIADAKNGKGKILLEFKKNSRPVLLWAFEPKKKMKKVLGFETSAEKIGEKFMQTEFQKAFNWAIQSAK